MSAPVYQTLTVATKEQSYLLAELNMTHGRLFRLLGKIRDNASTSLKYVNLDTLFLMGAVRDLPECVATYEALRHAAKLGGCTREEIAAVCTTDRLIIEGPTQ